MLAMKRVGGLSTWDGVDNQTPSGDEPPTGFEECGLGN